MTHQWHSRCKSGYRVVAIRIQSGRPRAIDFAEYVCRQLAVRKFCFNGHHDMRAMTMMPVTPITGAACL